MDLAVTVGIGGAVLGIVALLSVLVLWISLRRWRARCISLEVDFAALRRDLERAASISARAGQQVKRIEQQYAGVADRVDLVESRGAAGSFDQAIEWARRGADAGQLSHQFGLSRSEAELVSRLHGRKRAEEPVRVFRVSPNLVGSASAEAKSATVAATGNTQTGSWAG